MRLTRLRIDRLPGIDEPYEITAEGPGVHVVFGPNAVGKSSICRAVAALYWEDVRSGERTEHGRHRTSHLLLSHHEHDQAHRQQADDHEHRDLAVGQQPFVHRTNGTTLSARSGPRGGGQGAHWPTIPSR